MRTTTAIAPVVAALVLAGLAVPAGASSDAAAQVSAIPSRVTGTAHRPDGTVTVRVTIVNPGSRPVRETLVESGPSKAGSLVPQVPGHAGRAWVDIADQPAPTADGSVSVHDGLVYSVGGFSAVTGEALTSMYVYDPSTDSWSSGPHTLLAHDGANSAWIDGLLYVTGGFANPGATEAYDPMTRTWTTRASNPIPRNESAQAVVRGRLYVIGGVTADDNLTASVEAYDPDTDTWRAGAEYPSARLGLACGAIDDVVYCAGGCCTDAGDTSVATYAYDGRSWTRRADLPVGTAGSSYAVTAERLLLAGLVTDGGQTSTASVGYEPRTDRWRPLPDVHHPAYNVRGSCGLFKIGGVDSGFNVVPSEASPNHDVCPDAVSQVRWLSESRRSVTVPSGAARSFTVTLDASGLRPGIYHATLAARGDLPGSTVRLPVRFTVTAAGSN